MRCLKCNGLHHTSIFDAETVGASNPRRVSAGSQVGESSVTHTTPNAGTSVNIAFSQSKGAILLQTAQAYVVRPDGETPSH